MEELGCIEYNGEMILITWNDYLSLLWNKSDDIVIVTVPKNPEKK